jgi:hypothetical protein
MSEYHTSLNAVKEEYKNSENGIIVAKDYLNDDGKKSKYFIVLNKKELASIKKDNHFYELILEKEFYCYKMYYDIDLYIDKEKIDEYDNKLNNFLDIITKYYKELDKSFNKDDIIELDASRDNTDGKYKISKHFILPVYVEKPENLYVLFTHINTMIQDGIDAEIYDAIDKEVYIKTPKKSHQLRLLGQTKIGKPQSILKCKNADIKLKDTLITQYDTANKKLIKTDDMEVKLKKRAEKRGYMITGVEHTIDKTDLEMGKMGYNYKDMLNINLKIPKLNVSINNMEIINYYRENGFSIESDCKLYLSVILNTPLTKQSFRIWWVIGTILKKYNIDYKIYEEWTLKAYNTDLNKVADECRKKWDMMKTTKYGLIHLINIAKLYNKELYLKKIFAKKFINQYYYDKEKWETIKMGADETMDINKYYKDGKIGLITDENVGGGKTNSVIRFTKENINRDHFTIIFSNRILFATDISSRFEKELGKDKVINYDENRSEIPDLKDIKVLVISFESLLKWKEAIKKRCSKTTKLICIYDEFETLHRNLNGETIKKPYKTITYLSELWRKSAFNIIIDAYMTINTYEYVNKLNELSGKKGDMIYIDTDNRNKYPKTFNIRTIAKTSSDRDNMMKCYTAEMGKVLNENPDNKIVIFCEVYTSVQYIVSYLINTLKIPVDKILKHTGKDKDYMTEEEIEKAKSYFKDKEKMKDIRVWIYTSSILNGISVENVKFAKCFGIITKYSKQLQSSVGILGNDFLNAIARSRLNNEWELYVDEKENIAFTYRKYKETNTDVSIDSKIDVAVAKELNTEELKKRVEENDTEDEDEMIDLAVEIAELNSYIRNPIKYRFETTSGMCGINYIKVYEKYDMTGKEIYTIPYDKYMEWKDKEYLTGDPVANDIINIVIRNNIRTEELNGIYKVEVVECLAKLKNNNINWCLDDMTIEAGLVCGQKKSVVISNWDKRDIYNIDKIHTIVEKYYGIDGASKDEFVKIIMGDFNLRRNIENWISIKNKEKNDSFNPIFAIDMLRLGFNIEKLKDLTDVLYPEKIEELELYDKCKDVINKFKRSIGCKITPDPKTRKTSVYMKYLNEILKNTGYYYKEVTKQRYIIKYELVRPNIEIIVNGEDRLITYNYLEKIWDYDGGRKLTFVDDDDE